MTRSTFAALFAAALSLLALPSQAHAFTNVAVGERVADAKLATVEGRSASLFGDEPTTLFVFVRAQQPQSIRALGMLAKLRDELPRRQVRIVAVLSGNASPAEVAQIVLDAGDVPVLIDEDDKLYGRLGAYSAPAAGVVNFDHRLVAFEAYTTLNYVATLRHRVEQQLGNTQAVAAVQR